MLKYDQMYVCLFSYRDNDVYLLTYLVNKVTLPLYDHDIVSTYYVDYKYNLQARGVCIQHRTFTIC